MLREMCAFSNLSTGRTTAKESGYGGNFRPSNRQNQGLMSTKNIVEDYEIALDVDVGTNGRPRFREEVKLPP